MGTDGLNSSRLGVRGTEDLGGGLSAGFWLEGSVNPNDGSGPLTFQRRATISLVSAKWGKVRVGRDYTPTFWTRASYDPFGENALGMSGNVDPQFIQPIYVRASNSISYLSPNTLGGAYGQVMTAAGEGSSNGK